MSFGLAELQEVFEKLPKGMQKQSCIAGGAVRDALIGRKPDDIDIFLFDNLAEYVHAQYLDETEFEDTETFEKGYGEDDDGVYYAEATYKEHKVQIIEAKKFGCSVENLVENFDWNICQFAFDSQGLRCFESPEILWPGGILRARKGALNRPERAVKRGREFASRYSLTLPYGELRKIALHTWAAKRNKKDAEQEWLFGHACRRTEDFFEEVAAAM